MLTPHHSFSSRIFLNETKETPASPPAASRKPADEIRDFWWFLRAGQAKEQRKATRDRNRDHGGGFGHQGGAHA